MGYIYGKCYLDLFPEWWYTAITNWNQMKKSRWRHTVKDLRKHPPFAKVKTNRAYRWISPVLAPHLWWIPSKTKPNKIDNLTRQSRWGMTSRHPEVFMFQHYYLTLQLTFIPNYSYYIHSPTSHIDRRMCSISTFPY